MLVALVTRQWRRSFVGVACLLLTIVGACSPLPTVNSAVIPPIPPGMARIWVYRTFLPSETLNMTAVQFNGAYAGFAQMGGAFYRDVPPGIYHVTVDSYGVDFNQSTNVAVVPGQQVYIKIESLRSWVECGRRCQRDTFYAWLIPTPVALAEIGQSFYNGGS